jgi:glutamate dehydrogenase/leucine dehydrogenase
MLGAAWTNSPDGVSAAPRLHITAQDDKGVVGYLVIDTLINGPSHGGVRLHRNVIEGALPWPPRWDVLASTT